MKGIILAGGSGTRLYPSTKSVSKQLLPVYDKPTIYYPLSSLMLGGIRDILIISTPRDIPLIQDLFENGHWLGLNISYATQEKPNGIPMAFLIGEKFINRSKVCLILGDNIFYGHDMSKLIEGAIQKKSGASVFAYHVQDPQRYGVVEFDQSGRALSIEEKPIQPRSNWAVTGLYFYDENVVEYTKTLKPSKRAETEITDLNNLYLQKGLLEVISMGRGMAWLDTGTHDSLLQASTFVQTIEHRQGQKIACLEEIAFLKGFITKDQFGVLAENCANSSYGHYLKNLIKFNFIK